MSQIDIRIEKARFGWLIWATHDFSRYGLIGPEGWAPFWRPTRKSAIRLGGKIARRLMT